VTPESILAAPRFLELLVANCCDSKWAEERGSQILEGVEQASDGMSRIGRRLRPRSRAKPGIRACQILFAMLVLMAANLPVAKAGTGSALPAVAGDSGSKEFTITVLPSGTEMEYSGRIEFSSSGALRSALNGNPAVKILHLTSNGGSVGYGRKMEYLVHDRGLTTVVDAHCLSACVLVFLGGQERYLAPGAKLGFHRESAPGMSPAEIDMVEETDAQFMRAMGITSSFVEKAFSIPSSEIWIPTVDELKAAHVITDVSTKFATPDDVKIAPNLAAQLLEENPFKILQTRDPARYKALRDQVILAIGEHDSQRDVQSLPTRDIAPLSLVYFPHASDAMAIDFAQALQSYLTKLGRANPDACYFILYPERAPAGFAADDVLAGDEWKDFADLQARLVSDGALRNAAVPSKSDVDAALAAMAQQLRQQNPNLASALSNLDSPTSDHGAACSAMTEMLAAILTLPFRQKGPLVRYVFGSY